MTKLFCVSCDILFCVMLLVSTASAQVQWTKYASNPVITLGPASWDIIAIGQPTALLENDTIKMWYAGVGTDMKARICYAWSLDGFNWIKHANPVLDVGAAGSWDSGWLDTPEIVRDNTGYKLYYYGDTAQQNAAISSAIGLAYSPDGINWTREASNPVFIKGTFGDWDGTWVESPAIVWDSISGLYSMWYNGVDTATWKVLIGLATSSDGVSWTRYAGNPVLNTGAWGSYDDMWLGTPALLKIGGQYQLWYSGTRAASYNVALQRFDTISICYASSSDGISWNKSSSNPLFNTFTAPYDSLVDTGGPWGPDVVYLEGTETYMMWYESFGGFGLATAPVDHTRLNERQETSLLMFPNPASDRVTVGAEPCPGTLMLCDITGREIFCTCNWYGGSFDVSMLQDGFYTVTFDSSGKHRCGFLLIQR